jgi:hypothetical protein
MKGIELLEKYPEAAKVITEFYNNKLIDSMDTEEITEEFKEMIKSQEFDNQYVATFIDSNPRFLFDVFDSNGIFISIKYGLDGFTWSNMQSDASELKDTTIYLFRKEAEAVAVEKAFEILNEQLCQTK